jgi:uncharacterized protein YciI
MYFIVIRERGAGWDESRAFREQDQWTEHGDFMDALHDAGSVVVAGPIGDGTRPHRALIVVQADDVEAVHALLADDPWTVSETLVTVSVEPWDVLIGRSLLQPTRP